MTPSGSNAPISDNRIRHRAADVRPVARIQRGSNPEGVTAIGRRYRSIGNSTPMGSQPVFALGMEAAPRTPGSTWGRITSNSPTERRIRPRRNASIMDLGEIDSGRKIQYLLAIDRTVIFYTVIELYGVPRWIDRHSVEALSG